MRGKAKDGGAMRGTAWGAMLPLGGSIPRIRAPSGPGAPGRGTETKGSRKQMSRKTPMVSRRGGVRVWRDRTNQAIDCLSREE